MGNGAPVIGRRRQPVEDRPGDGGLAPLHLVAVDRELELAIGQGGNEALGTLCAKIERFVESDILEVAPVEDREQRVARLGIEPCGSEDLAPKRHGVVHLDRAKVQAVLGKADPELTCGMKRAPFADRLAHVVAVDIILLVHAELTSW